ncbi:LuxR C-terminal-related transcriptional regulator [Streptomyces sp. NPDC085932]|uniref:LuxR C-terminal-related transcriptional regulator n=1 Tax=Streptomyces sp. NPDC085932 TaxID=3365741 RepID=UPI0037D43698
MWRDLSASTRDFLLDTATLGRFSVTLADFVRDQDDSAHLVDQVRRDGLFLVFEDETGAWLHYQRMFQQSLAQRLEVTNPSRSRFLHQRAAQWHARVGHSEDAVEHAMKACDFRLAAGLMQKVFDSYYDEGHLITLERWLSALPDEVIRENPRFLKQGLNLWCSLGRFDERDRWAHIQDIVDPERPATDDVWRLCLPRERGDLALALRSGRRILSGGPQSAFTSRMVPTQAGIAVARSLLLAGQFAECLSVISEISERWERRLPPPALRVSLNGLHGLAAYMSGDLEEARNEHDRMLDALVECGIRPSPRTIPESVILRALFEVSPSESVRKLESLVDASPGLGGDRTMRIFALLHLTDVLSRVGNGEEAASRLAQADRELEELPSPMGLADFRNSVATEVTPEGVAPAPVDLLSEREMLILQYLRSRLTLREIAADLFLSINTVKTHSRNIYRKLGVENRHQAANLPLLARPFDDVD